MVPNDEIIPSLDSAGWITGIQEKADALMAYSFASRASQSVIYAGQITSLPAIIQEFGHNQSTLSSEIQRRYDAYFRTYFATVKVDVDVSSVESNEAILDIKLSVIITSDGTNYSLGRLVRTANKKIQSITPINIV